MRTPRNIVRSRGIGTLIGNGWLRESPRTAAPSWELRGGKSALRHCMFLPCPPSELRAGFKVASSAFPAPTYRVPRADDVIVHARNPLRDAREFPAMVLASPPERADAHAAAKIAHAARVQHAQKVAAAAASGKAPRSAWWDDPIALGSLLILVPPIGLAAVWGSKRYSSDARWALTIMTALTMCLMSAIVIAVLVKS